MLFYTTSEVFHFKMCISFTRDKMSTINCKQKDSNTMIPLIV